MYRLIESVRMDNTLQDLEECNPPNRAMQLPALSLAFAKHPRPFFLRAWVQDGNYLSSSQHLFFLFYPLQTHTDIHVRARSLSHI